MTTYQTVNPRTGEPIAEYTLLTSDATDADQTARLLRLQRRQGPGDTDQQRQGEDRQERDRQQQRQLGANRTVR